MTPSREAHGLNMTFPMTKMRTDFWEAMRGNLMDKLDTETYRQRRIHEAKAKYAWRTAGAARMSQARRSAWQTEFRHQFDTALGGLRHWKRPSLKPVVTETKQMDGYRREGITFTSRPGLEAFGWFLTPEDCPTAQPAMICLPGHGVGVDGIVGITEEAYSQNFALQCVRRGYPTFVLELTGFGRRRDAAARAAGPGSSSCVRDSMAALMLGETMSGWRVWDTMRALDYLETRAEVVDPTRIGVMGISGGGLTALFSGALDTRIRSTVVNSYFNTFQASVLSIDHCVDNYVPDLLNICEMPDIAALVAPRALFAVSGTKDPIFPIAAFEQAVAQAHDTYKTFGVPAQFGSEVFEGDHRFHGDGAFTFLEKTLQTPWGEPVAHTKKTGG